MKRKNKLVGKASPLANGRKQLMAVDDEYSDKSLHQAVQNEQQEGNCARARVWVHVGTEDFSLHSEIEKGVSGLKDVDLHTFLDATGFWETPYRSSGLEQAVHTALASCGPYAVLAKDLPRRATDNELQCGGAVSARYLRQLHQVAQKAGRQQSWLWLDRDKTTVVTGDTEDAARRAVGATLAAVEVVLDPECSAKQALVLARPPGHHNGCDERLEQRERHSWRHAAHGGCIFNETAIAIKNLRRHHPSWRFVVLDLDAHFGDGTAWHFYEDAKVLCISLHVDQSDSHVFPYLKGKPLERGAGAGEGYTLNLPILEGMGDAEALRLLEEIAFPEILRHDPHLLFLSLGFDGLQDDPSGAGLCLTEQFFEQVAARCGAVCDKVVCTLQGGYLPQAMASAAAGVLRVLAGQSPIEAEPSAVCQGFEDHLASVRSQLANKDSWWSVEHSFSYVPDGFEDMDETGSSDG